MNKNYLKYYISSIKNKIFINQRKKAINLKKTKLIDLGNKYNTKSINEIYFFTLCNNSLIKFSGIFKFNKKIKKISYFEEIHTATYFSSKIFSNKIIFLINEMLMKTKIKLKLLLKNNFYYSIFLIKVYYKYILVSSSNNIFLKKEEFFKKKIILSLPYFEKNSKKKELFINNTIKKNKKNIFLFDSHFPMHPDSFTNNKNNIQIAKKLINYYLNFLDENLCNNKNRFIFLNPRTYYTIKNTTSIYTYLKEFNKFYFYNGISCFLNFSDKKGDIFIQPGTQLSTLKSKMKKINNKIKILSLDDKFINKFQFLKTQYKSQYLNNYEIIEIKQYKNLDKEKFIKYS